MSRYREAQEERFLFTGSDPRYLFILRIDPKAIKVVWQTAYEGELEYVLEIVQLFETLVKAEKGSGVCFVIQQEFDYKIPMLGMVKRKLRTVLSKVA